jgi:hypothetical protein
MPYFKDYKRERQSHIRFVFPHRNHNVVRKFAGLALYAIKSTIKVYKRRKEPVATIQVHNRFLFLHKTSRKKSAALHSNHLPLVFLIRIILSLSVLAPSSSLLLYLRLIGETTTLFSYKKIIDILFRKL